MRRDRAAPSPINGALSYENLYTLNGAVIVENLRGAAYPLYIEDALQEVTVATAGVSAEYGRFTGGMVERGHQVRRRHVQRLASHVVCERLLALDRRRPPTIRSASATARKPVTKPMYEATLGGPIAAKASVVFWRDAHPKRRNRSRRTLADEPVRTRRTNDEKRYEGKLTYAPRPAHSMQGSYIKIDQTQTNFTSQNVMDLASLADAAAAV